MVMLVRLVLLPPAAVGVNVEVYLLLAAENHSEPEVNPTYPRKTPLFCGTKEVHELLAVHAPPPLPLPLIPRIRKVGYTA